MNATLRPTLIVSDRTQGANIIQWHKKKTCQIALNNSNSNADMTV